MRFGLFTDEVPGFTREVEVQDAIVFGLKPFLDSGYARGAGYSIGLGSLAILIELNYTAP